jgi:hypothetical protein
MSGKYAVMICYTRCDSCQYYGEHGRKGHSWAGPDDIDWYAEQGVRFDPKENVCGCWCQGQPQARRQMLHNGRKPR